MQDKALQKEAGGRQVAQARAPADGKDKDKDEGKPAPQEVERKILRTGEVQLIVDSLDQAERQLRQRLVEYKGYVDHFETRETPGSPRSGNWTVRVPSERFEDFMDAVSQLGEVRRRSSSSDDVTDRYYNMAAHVKNDESEEKSLRELLEKTSGKVENILAVRQALTDVRGRIEEQKSQLQRWDKSAHMSTVTVHLLDRKDYQPPLVPDFGSSVGRTFQGSVTALVEVGKFLVLAVVAIFPWLLVLAVPGIPWLLWRRRARATARTTPDAQ
jgi:hypothetical protein